MRGVEFDGDEGGIGIVEIEGHAEMPGAGIPMDPELIEAEGRLRIGDDLSQASPF